MLPPFMSLTQGQFHDRRLLFHDLLTDPAMIVFYCAAFGFSLLIASWWSKNRCRDGMPILQRAKKHFALQEATMAIRLGKIRRNILVALHRHKRWQRGGEWVWNTNLQFLWKRQTGPSHLFAAYALGHGLGRDSGEVLPFFYLTLSFG
jgi:hypothetical protein